MLLCTAIAPRVETRADDKPFIVGYAAVHYRHGDPGTEYRFGRYTERFEPGAFNKAATSPKIRAVWNHDRNSLLGRVSAGTLALTVDDIGLRYEVDCDHPLGRQVHAWVERGDAAGSSFAFRVKPANQAIKSDGPTMVRHISAVDVIEDVGPVDTPAYGSSTAEARMMEWGPIQDDDEESALQLIELQQKRMLFLT